MGFCMPSDLTMQPAYQSTMERLEQQKKISPKGVQAGGTDPKKIPIAEPIAVVKKRLAPPKAPPAAKPKAKAAGRKAGGKGKAAG